MPARSASSRATPVEAGGVMHKATRSAGSADCRSVAGRFFSIAWRGGSVTTHMNGDVTVGSFGGRLRVVFKRRSNSHGSPVVEIYSKKNLPVKHPAHQKVHFTRRDL